MTETILSPGIYIQETDQSFIPPGQTATGLAIVGPTEKGAAYVPTDVTSFADSLAGLNRGGLGAAINTRFKLFKADRDLLYTSRINPITKFNDSGVVIYGQKTLQVTPTALDRINVRRLLINLKRFVSDKARAFVFEQNTNATRKKLANIINPYLDSVKSNQGLYAYRVVIDDSNNTSDVIDRNELDVKIYISPTKTIEFILLNFNISPSGVSF